MKLISWLAASFISIVTFSSSHVVANQQFVGTWYYVTSEDFKTEEGYTYSVKSCGKEGIYPNGTAIDNLWLAFSLELPKPDEKFSDKWPEGATLVMVVNTMSTSKYSSEKDQQIFKPTAVIFDRVDAFYIKGGEKHLIADLSDPVKSAIEIMLSAVEAEIHKEATDLKETRLIVKSLDQTRLVRDLVNENGESVEIVSERSKVKFENCLAGLQ